MIVVGGGTYWEQCSHPQWNTFFGSAGRAAAVLAQLGESVRLATFGGEKKLPFLEALKNDFRFELGPVVPGPRILFKYDNPIGSPRIIPARHLLERNGKEVVADGDVVLRFGALEGTVVAKGKRVVYDPQDIDLPERFSANGSEAKELAIVCNLAEGRRLTGQVDPDEVGQELLSSQSAAVVVLKLGSAGAFIFEGGKKSTVPVYQTDSVFSIGSGDVFSAAFTLFWGRKQFPANEAAEKASRFAAYYCATTMLPTNEGEVDRLIQKPVTLKFLAPGATRPRVYLAGPFFTMGQVWVVEQALDAIRGLGMEVFSPYHEVGIGPAEDVVSKDIEELEKADIVYAIVDGLDAGTIFEVGYAIKRGIPVVAYQQNESEESMKMLTGTGVAVVSDFATSIYRLTWLANQ